MNEVTHEPCRVLRGEAVAILVRSLLSMRSVLFTAILLGCGTSKDLDLIFGKSAAHRRPENEPQPPHIPAPFKLAFFGDGIVHGCGYTAAPPSYDSYCGFSGGLSGFRDLVLKDVTATGYIVEEVGTTSYASPLQTSDPHWSTDQLSASLRQNNVYTAARPDIIFALVGLVDILRFVSSDVIAERTSTLLTDIYAAVPRTRVVLSTLLVPVNSLRSAHVNEYKNPLALC